MQLLKSGETEKSILQWERNADWVKPVREENARESDVLKRINNLASHKTPFCHWNFLPAVLKMIHSLSYHWVKPPKILSLYVHTYMLEMLHQSFTVLLKCKCWTLLLILEAASIPVMIEELFPKFLLKTQSGILKIVPWRPCMLRKAIKFKWVLLDVKNSFLFLCWMI